MSTYKALWKCCLSIIRSWAHCLGWKCKFWRQTTNSRFIFIFFSFSSRSFEAIKKRWLCIFNALSTPLWSFTIIISYLLVCTVSSKWFFWLLNKLAVSHVLSFITSDRFYVKLEAEVVRGLYRKEGEEGNQRSSFAPHEVIIWLE